MARKTCHLERVAVKSMGNSCKNFVVQHNAMVTHKSTGASGSAGSLNDTTVQQTKTVVLRSNALVLQKVVSGGQQWNCNSSEVPRQLPVTPGGTASPCKTVAVVKTTPPPCTTDRCQPLALKTISLFEDDWKEDDNEPDKHHSNQVDVDTGNDKRKTNIGLYCESRPECEPQSIGFLGNVVDVCTPMTKTNFQSLTTVESSNEQGLLSSQTQSDSLLPGHEGLKILTNKRRIIISDDPSYQRLSIGKSLGKPVLLDSANVRRITYGPKNSLKTVQGARSSTLSIGCKADVNALVPSTDITAVQVQSQDVGCELVSGTSMVRKKAVGTTGKRICTIRPYGRVQDDVSSPIVDASSTESCLDSNVASNDSINVPESVFLTERNLGFGSELRSSADNRTSTAFVRPDSRPATGNFSVPSSASSSGSTDVSTVFRTIRSTKGHMDSYSYTYSRIQSLWDNSKFEDDDLVLQPFQSDVSSNSIVLGHISEGSMKD